MKSCSKCTTETCLVACISSVGEEGAPGRCPRGFWWLENQGKMHTLTPYHLCPQSAAPLGKKTSCYFSNHYFFFFFSLHWMRKEDTRCQPGRHFHAEQEHADLLLPSNYFCPNCRGFITSQLSFRLMPWRVHRHLLLKEWLYPAFRTRCSSACWVQNLAFPCPSFLRGPSLPVLLVCGHGLCSRNNFWWDSAR